MVTQFWLFIVIFFGSWFGVSPTPLEPVTLLLPETTITAVVAHVVDGDTIDVQIGTTTTLTRVRYIGINTPEPYPKNSTNAECGSSEATAANRVLVEGQSVTLVTGSDPFDSYDRLLAYVFVGEVFVNEELLRRGYATTLSIEPNTRYQSLFADRRDEAKVSSLGSWQTCHNWR